jgi:hypothetical protein
MSSVEGEILFLARHAEKGDEHSEEPLSTGGSFERSAAEMLVLKETCITLAEEGISNYRQEKYLALRRRRSLV